MGPCESRMLPSQVVRLLGGTVRNYQKHSSHKNTPLTFDLTWLRRRTSLEGSNFQFQKLHYHLWIGSAARISKKSRMLFRKTIKVETMKHQYIDNSEHEYKRMQHTQALKPDTKQTQVYLLRHVRTHCKSIRRFVVHNLNPFAMFNCNPKVFLYPVLLIGRHIDRPVWSLHSFQLTIDLCL